jgi:prepilin-type N-terminal cleavage/methylation domain-containing protein
MNRDAFTMLELMTVVIILGILTAIALPNYLRFVEQARADQAITYLKVIRTGEKIYYADNSAYIACGSAAGGASANAAAIKTNLGVEVTTEAYNFYIAAPSSPSGTFTATAKRLSNDKTITLNQDGTWGGTSSFVPAN